MAQCFILLGRIFLRFVNCLSHWPRIYWLTLSTCHLQTNCESLYAHVYICDSQLNDTEYICVAIRTIHLENSDFIFVLGDFNIPSVDWIKPNGNLADDLNVMISVNVFPVFAGDFLDATLCLGYNQINSIFNDSSRLIAWFGIRIVYSVHSW